MVPLGAAGTQVAVRLGCVRLTLRKLRHVIAAGTVLNHACVMDQVLVMADGTHQAVHLRSL